VAFLAKHLEGVWDRGLVLGNEAEPDEASGVDKGSWRDALMFG
jgi:hypothetical protein